MCSRLYGRWAIDGLTPTAATRCAQAILGVHEKPAQTAEDDRSAEQQSADTVHKDSAGAAAATGAVPDKANSVKSQVSRY